MARNYGVARSWVYTLLARYQAEGDAAFEPRSRRPKTSPSAISASTVELITGLRKEVAGQGLDAGPHTIAWHLEHRHKTTVSPTTVSRSLTRAGLVTPDPAKIICQRGGRNAPRSFPRLARDRPSRRNVGSWLPVMASMFASRISSGGIFSPRERSSAV